MAVECQAVHAGRCPTLQSSRPRARIRSLAAAHRDVRRTGEGRRVWGEVQIPMKFAQRVVTALVLVLLAAALAAEAQSRAKLWRIGYLSVAQVESDKSWVGAFRDGLRELGYVEGQNLVLQQRHAGGHSERLPELAAELLQLRVDILVVYGAWLEPKKLPSVIPIVFTVAPDPVREGLVASLARPGGNITGLSD